MTTARKGAYARRVEKEDQATRAVQVFKTMLPTLNGYVHALTDKSTVKIVPKGGDVSARTDGKSIFISPPFALGTEEPHVRQDCDRRDGLQLRCPACRAREATLILVYHEVAHIVYESFEDAPSDPEKKGLLSRSLAMSDAAFAKGVLERISRLPSSKTRNYLGLASAISPFMPPLLNSLEDARVNRMMVAARPGIKAMFAAQIESVMLEGMDGAGERLWIDEPLNMQMIIGLFVKAGGYVYSGWFDEKVVTDLDNHDLVALLEELERAETAGAVYDISFRTLIQLRKMGYCKLPDEDDEEEEADEPEEEEADTGESGEPGEPADDEPGEEGRDDSPSELEEDDASDGDESGAGGDSEEEGSAGDGEAEPSDESGESGESDDGAEGDPGGSTEPELDEDPDGDSDGVGTDSEAEGDESPTGSGDRPGDDEDDAGEGDAEGGSGTEEPGEEVDDESDPSEAEGPGEEDSEEGASGSGSEDGAGSGGSGSVEADDEPGDEGSESSSDPSPGDPAESSPEEGDDGGSDGGDDSAEPDDGSGADSTEPVADDDAQEGAQEPDDGDEPTPDDGDDLEVEYGDDAGILEALGRMTGHVDMDSEDSAQEKEIMSVAVEQGEYFDRPSRNILGVKIIKHDPVRGQKDTPWQRKAHTVDRRDREWLGLGVDLKIPESILGPALMRLRVAMSDNARGRQLGNLKSGKVNARVLGKRVFGDDERLFRKKSLPGKKDYFVLIGMDVSGSAVGKNIVLEKRAVAAQAELLTRLGVRFSIYAHSGDAHYRGDRMNLVICEVKGPNEQWGVKERARLDEIHPFSANLDGHTLEFYRKRLDEERATDKILMYYTDGHMPLENYSEELSILTREIGICKKKNYALMGVGINSDSPIEHGLDTVVVSSDADISGVVKHLERRLLSM